MPKLSVVIAAYNEERRLPATLEYLVPFLRENVPSFEIVIVDDGSRDRTREAVFGLQKRFPEIRLLSHFPNQGRGASIREGVLAAEGEFILETDADGSTDKEAIVRFLRYFEEHTEIDVVFGSRELPDSKIARGQSFLRVFLGYGFLYLARLMLWSWRTTDFTLGFKMFKRKAAEDIFRHQYDNHYVAEAEIVYIAKRRGWHAAESPVTWTDNRDSRVRPFRDSFRSFCGMCKVLLRDMRGAYG